MGIDTPASEGALPRIAITAGDPAGIGPEIAVKAARDYAKAKVDLEAFLQSGSTMDFPKQQAQRMLLAIGAKK